MKRKWLVFYLVNWYAFAVSGLLMSQQAASGHWLSDLPWTSWGTELVEGLGGAQAVSGDALWILMGAALVFTGVLGSVAASIVWLADPSAARMQREQRERPAHEASTVTPGDQAQALASRSQEAAELVEDPKLRALIQRLNTRLG